MTNTVHEPRSLVGRVVFDAVGQEIGPVRRVYLHRVDGQPEWVAVKTATGRLGVAPLAGATIYEDSLQIPFSAADVDAGPHQTVRLVPAISEAVTAALYRHYGLQGTAGSEGPAAAATAAAKDQSRQVASTAADEAQQVASTAKERGQDLVATSKDKAQELVQTATEHAGAVVETAKQQASQVVGEVSEQAHSLLEEAKSQIQTQAEDQTGRLAETLRQLGQQARALADGRPAEAPTVEGYVSQAAEQLSGLAERLTELQSDIAANGPGVVLDDLKSFARRRPAIFLVGAMLVGFGGVRLIQGGNDQPGGTDRSLPSTSLPRPTTAPPYRSPRS